jgi:DNA-binding response OmpR family regulator
MYALKLKHEGFEVSTAKNGAEGLEVIEKVRPQLILLDIRMPVMSGDEMLRELRNKDYGEEIKVIILTNVSKDEAPLGLRMLGVDRYIVKAHYTPSQVAAIVREVLGS